jgi:hypothetical protein
MSKREGGQTADQSLIDQDQVLNARVSWGPSSVGTEITRSFRPALERAIEKGKARRDAIGLPTGIPTPKDTSDRKDLAS